MQKTFGTSNRSEIIADGRSYSPYVGTCRLGETYVLTVLVPRDQAVLKLNMYLRKDDSEVISESSFSYVCLQEDYDVYQAELSNLEVGLYWISIEAGKHHWQEFLSRRGPYCYLDGDSAHKCFLQLTVYDRAYEVPSYLRGGIFYQIYPDRFYLGDEAKSISERRNVLEKDPIKACYDIVEDNQDFDNESHRALVLRSQWGQEPAYLPDRHGEILNNDFFGGSLQGIIDKLPYLNSLGVTCIYLNPIFEAYSNHRYDTGNYEKIDAALGTEEDFRHLCLEAEKYDIFILLDGVFNHTGADSKYFNLYGTYPDLGAGQSEKSPYYDWYGFEHYPDKYNSWWGITTLPTVEKNVASHKEYLFGKNGVIRKWIRLGACGWRLDVVDELPGDFLKELTQAAKEERKDALVLGEVWEDASNKVAYGVRREYFWGRELDSVMNYPWKDGIIEYLRTGNAESLAGKIWEVMGQYPPEVVDCLMNTLGTHDSVRILTALGAETPSLESRQERAAAYLDENELSRGLRRLKLAVMLQMTLPGVPCIYYGDEAQMEGYQDPFNRRCYPWDHVNKDLLNWYRGLGQFRNKNKNLFFDTSFNLFESVNGVLGFERFSSDGKGIRLIINRGPHVYVFSPEDREDDLDWQVFDMGYMKRDPSQVLPARETEEGTYMIPAEYGYLLQVGSPCTLEKNGLK